jgi:hypothetical protein
MPKMSIPLKGIRSSIVTPTEVCGKAIIGKAALKNGGRRGAKGGGKNKF